MSNQETTQQESDSVSLPLIIDMYNIVRYVYLSLDNITRC